LLDLVADVRASTPTDAARRIVPDLAEEQAGLAGARARARAALAARLDREQHALDLLRTRPVLAQPRRWLQAHADEVRGLMDRARRAMWGRLDRADDNITHLHARLLALSPAATLARGYAVLTRHDDGRVVRRPADAPQGTLLIARLAHGRVGATSAGSWDE
jgi:exodeoxyribonuclease VII large subunit